MYLKRLAKIIIEKVRTFYYIKRYSGRIECGRNCILRSIKISGKGLIRVLDNATVDDCQFVFWGRTDNYVEIGPKAIIHGFEIIEYKGENRILIGEKTTIGGAN